LAFLLAFDLPIETPLQHYRDLIDFMRMRVDGFTLLCAQLANHHLIGLKHSARHDRVDLAVFTLTA